VNAFDPSHEPLDPNSPQEGVAAKRPLSRSLENDNLSQFGGEQPYRFNSREVNVDEMLAKARLASRGRFDASMARVEHSPHIWSQDDSMLNLKKMGLGAQSVFEPATGTMMLPGPISSIRQPALRSFFEAPGRSFRFMERVVVRGPSYYTARDVNLSPEQKLDSMECDIRDALKVVAQVDRASLRPHEYLYFLSTLEYLKAHCIGLYQVVTHSERRGDFSADSEYNLVKNFALQLSKVSVRSFYQHVLGHGLEYLRSDNLYSSRIDEVFNYCRSDGFRSRLREPNRFKLQECDQPVVLALNGHENALRFHDVEAIVSLPLGGLQPGLVTQFAFELIHEREVPLITVPLSMHSGAEHRNDHLTIDDLVRVIAQYDVKGKVVLVTEDNSNTGKTAAVISQALYSAGAKRVHVSLVELDFARVEHKQKNRERYGAESVVNLNHPDFVTAIRTVPIRVRRGVDQQQPKLWADRVCRQGWNGTDEARRAEHLSE
jgi:hypothetical protein